MSTPSLILEGHVAWIVLERPERHNAIQAADVARLHKHLHAVDADPSVRVLILAARGNHTFCSGASLPEIETGVMSGGLLEKLADRIAAVRVPTVCALSGSAFGGGAELALACDFRIGVHGMRVRIPAARLGLCYPAGGLRRYVAALGVGVSTRLFLGVEELDADELLRVGFLHSLVSPEELADTAEEIAATVSDAAPLAIQAMKRLLRASSHGPPDETEARDLIARCESSDDFREGLLAYREGRRPAFHGR